MPIACFSYVILNFVDLIIIIALTLLKRIVMSFVWRKFSSVGREEWCNKMKNGQKLKLGDAHVTPRNIQEVQASKLGYAQGIPFFINKVSGHLSRRYIFIASYTMCYSWSVLVFIFCFFLFCFLYYIVGSQQICFGADTLRFNCKEHSSFHSYCFPSVLFF